MSVDPTSDDRLTAGDVRRQLERDKATWRVAEGLEDGDVLPPFSTGVSPETIEELRLGLAGGLRQGDLAQDLRDWPPTNAFLIRRWAEEKLLPAAATEGLDPPRGPLEAGPRSDETS